MQATRTTSEDIIWTLPPMCGECSRELEHEEEECDCCQGLTEAEMDELSTFFATP